jgi:uncharacterized protein (TIGR02246 family)
MTRITRLYLCVGLAFVGSLSLWANGPEDLTNVRALIPAFTDSWNRAQPEAIAALFADGGDLVIPSGETFRGRAEIGAFYQSVFARGYSGSVGGAQIVYFRFLGPEVALMDGTWSISGAHDDQQKPRPAERGVFTAVVVKEHGQWRINALREQTSATELKLPGQ